MSNLLYPSKKPKVSQVHEWRNIYSYESDPDWRWTGGGSVMVCEGYPFPDFLRVQYWPVEGKKVTKYFYGEMAIHDCRRYVSDLGFIRAHYEIR